MFTGLVEERGRLSRVTPKGPGMSLIIEASRSFVQSLSLGESVAVDGACMTVTHAHDTSFSFDASAESMSRTTLGKRRAGDELHLERALRLGDRVGGHLVSGHIDGLGKLMQRTKVGEAVLLQFALESTLLPYLIEKGSIAIDGISLTINELFDDGFSVMLIPHTQSVVHLHDKALHGDVNIEVDQIGKYVERLLGLSGEITGSKRSKITMTRLRELGYLT
jgi:riboflavin synthase